MRVGQRQSRPDNPPPEGVTFVTFTPRDARRPLKDPHPTEVSSGNPLRWHLPETIFSVPSHTRPPTGSVACEILRIRNPRSRCGPNPWRNRGPHHVQCPDPVCRPRCMARHVGLPRHRPRSLLPDRDHRAGHRADRVGLSRLRDLRREGHVPRLRPHHQSGLRYLGRHFRGRAPQDPSPVARRPPTRFLNRPSPGQFPLAGLSQIER